MARSFSNSIHSFIGNESRYASSRGLKESSTAPALLELEKKKKKITRRIKVSKNLKGYERRRINDDAQHYGGLQHGGGREREEVEFRGKRVPFAKPVFSSSYIVLLTRV